MNILADVAQKVFDTEVLKRGNAIRIKRHDGTVDRMGLVHKATPTKLTILYSNVQNTAVSYYEILASDVALGIWEIYWSADLMTVHHEGSREEEAQWKD